MTTARNFEANRVPWEASPFQASSGRSNRFGHRSAWTVVDQALSASSNFVLMVLVARTSSRHEFGAFGLTFAIYLIGVALNRSLCSDPFLVRFTTASDEDRRHAAQGVVGSSVTVALAASLVCLMASLWFGGFVGAPLRALALVLPALLVQDATRFIFIANGEPRWAAANDFLWLLGLGALLGATAGHMHDASTMLLLWGISGGLAAVVALVQLRLAPSVRLALHWWKDNRDLAVGFTADTLTGYVVQQAVTFALAARVGVSAVAGVRGAQTLIGPMNVLVVGSLALTVPEGARALRQSVGSLRTLAASVSLALVSVTSLCLCAALFLPSSLGTSLLGRAWPATHTMLLPVGLVMVANAANVGAVGGIRATAQARRILRARFTAAPIQLGFVLVGVFLFRAAGAIWGMTIAAWISAAIWWIHFLRSLDDIEAMDSPVGVEPKGELTADCKTREPLIAMTA
jgi:O-antigen/teichoic acid export membrane protein